MDITKMARPAILKRPDPGLMYMSDERRKSLESGLRLFFNENPLGTSPKVIEAIVNEARKGCAQYPDAPCTDLRRALAARHGVQESQIFVDNGADAVICTLGMTFIGEGDVSLLSDRTFETYGDITATMGGRAVEVPLTGRAPSREAFLKALAAEHRTKVIWICNPNNPTGVPMPKSEMEALLTAVPENVLVAVDEAYYDFVDDPDYPQTIPMLEKHNNLVVLRTFSKVMGMASMRVGYAVGNPEVIRMMLRAREPFSVNGPAQAGALAALEDKEFYDAVVRHNAEQRERVSKGLQKLGLRVWPSQTNFVYAELPEGAKPGDSGKLAAALFDEGIIIKSMSFAGYPTPQNDDERPVESLRLSIGTVEGNGRALEALARAMGK